MEPTKISMPKTRSGINRGFAFAYFADRELGNDIIEKLNGLELDGRKLSVSETRERPPAGTEAAATSSRGFRSRGPGRQGLRGRFQGRGRGRGRLGTYYPPTGAGEGDVSGGDQQQQQGVPQKGPEPILKYHDKESDKEIDVNAVIVENISLSTTESGFLQLLRRESYPILRCDFGEIFDRRTGNKTHRAFLLTPQEAAKGLVDYLNSLKMDNADLEARLLHSNSQAARRLVTSAPSTGQVSAEA